MKYVTCFLTFFSYASLHTLRMCYSFNKMYIKKEFQITDFYLGVLDALVYLSLGIGTLLRFTLIRNPVNLTKIFLAGSILTSLFISVISFLGLISHGEKHSEHHYLLFKIFITIALSLFGFMQLTSRPIVAVLLGAQLNTYEHGCLIGAWASHSSFGHITGLFLSNLLVHTFELKWQVCIFIGGILTIITAELTYFYVENPIDKVMKKDKSITQEQKQKAKQQMRRHSSHEFYRFIRWMLHSTEYKFYMLTYIIMKGMVYTFLLWYPLFLDSVNLKRYSGYITILFEVAAIIGSFVLGKLYEYNGNGKNQSQLQERNQRGVHNENGSFISKISEYKSLICMTCTAIAIGVFYFSKGSMLSYSIFSFSIGLFLGGTLNTVASHDIMNFAQHDSRRIDLLTNFNIGLGSLFVGINQLMVGFALYEENQVQGEEGFTQRAITHSHHSYKILFLVLLILGIIVSIMFAIKLCIVKKKGIVKKSEDDSKQWKDLTLQSAANDFNQQVGY